MYDLQLATRNNPLIPQQPHQSGNPEFFFGEQSNDLQLNSLNDLAVVTGLDKTRQDIDKILLTEQGANTLFPLYGTNLQTLIGSKVNFGNLRANIQTQIVEALQLLYALTSTDTNPDEVVQTLHILGVQVEDTGEVDVNLSVITASGKDVATGLSVSLT